jgi:hypothetical protein
MHGRHDKHFIRQSMASHQPLHQSQVNTGKYCYLLREQVLVPAERTVSFVAEACNMRQVLLLPLRASWQGQAIAMLV